MTKTILKKTPHRLRVWQADNDLSDEQAAKKLGVHKRTYLRWCDGLNSPTIEQAQVVCDVTSNFVGLFDWQTPFTDKRRRQASTALKRRAGKAPAQKAKPNTRKE